MAAQHTMKLYGFGPTRSLRALWGLKELGVPFEFVPVDPRKGEHKAPAFLAINPAGKLPVLVDGDRAIPESAAIILYLAEKYPEKGLMPTSPSERAELYRWIMFGMTELEQPLWQIAKHTFLYPEDKRVPAIVAVAREEFSEMAKVLDAHMQGRPFVVGNRLSGADCVMAYIIDWANEANLLDGHRNLQAYLERLYARPSAPPRIAQEVARLGLAA
jgi:glutathione S-transferase